ncbi:hypothetical protein MATR_15190 [Marivirga tractuosa]|uniref:Two component regulator three Y domain-containing protein n=1 Tax=Marivirga tractuosa (strain ATCC 23168 / DSM 4126 / NBRC 15989 / NCIMB 1408 / VKM B-1430 / H-43) TaxID=643867 RepID=E4TT07_MARTH|nr:Two component regulator three Y domain-containing protein [Marivirga tractuosa DSM 4126]BDD14694.1 hypothetical protein MATR_15190 [Marivirga tractuosa]
MIILSNKTKQNFRNTSCESTRLSRIIVLLVLILCIGDDVSSQFYPAKLYSIRDGMPTNAVYDISQSPDGILWFMTSKGVATYNSLKWTLYPDSLKLPSSPYSFIRSLEDGSIWVAGQNSDGFMISYFKNKKWHSVNTKEIGEIKGKFTFDVKLKNENYSVVIGNEDYLKILNTSEDKLTKVLLPNHRTLQIHAVSFKDENIYISSSEGLFVFNESVTAHAVNKLIAPQKQILQIDWDDDDLYLLGKNWVGRYKNNEFEYLSNNTGVSNVSQFNKHNLTIDQFGRVFFSSMSSARFLNPASGKSEILFVNGRIFNAKSNKIFVDNENNIWVGDHRGLFKFNVLRFQNYNENIGLADDEVTAISTYQDQLVLANKTHLNLLEQGTIKERIALNYEPDMRILDIAYDGQNVLYMATNSAGLQVYDGKTVANINLPGLTEKRITTVEFIKDQLFFATIDALFSYQAGKITKEAELSGIRNISALDSDSIAAVSTNKGIYFYQPKTQAVHNVTSNSLNYRNVYNICKWKGQYFVGTSGGLAVITNNEIIPYFTTEKLNGVAVYSLFVSINNKLWIGTNEGVFIWDGQKLTNYNRSHGLIGDEINRNAFLQINKDKVWIGTELGASVYDYTKDISLEIIPNLKITKAATLEGQELNENTNTVNYNDNTIEFQFIGVSYFDENQIKYRYKLVGFDDEYLYINNSNSNSIRYTNLPPNNYEFQVQSSIDSDHWSPPKSMSFTVEKPFYATYWFLTSSILAIIIILYIIYRIRFNLILRNQEKLKKEVSQRTQEIQRMNSEIQAQNEELLSQTEEIATNNERLEEIVQDRTQKLQEQNERLSKYAFMNSHELRGPICRMIGLLNVLKISKSTDHKKLLRLIQETGLELDAITRQINQTLSTVDLNEVYESNSIENINVEISDNKTSQK